VAGLLVSVRSAEEALAALAGGAAVIDVKEPARGPLGRADGEIWRAVRRAVPPQVTVSVALGELREWRGADPPDPRDFEGIVYRKLGLAGSGPDWLEEWAHLRQSWGEGPAWVAVAYADWEIAAAPAPDRVIEAALAAGCCGLLIDTWDKSQPGRVDLSWGDRLRLASDAGLFIALAGGLDEEAMARLAPLDPDLFAVRGAACRRGDRLGWIDPHRVSRLAYAAATAPSAPSLHEFLGRR
jgi:(5-formylfuran-3-yl)methyl phosphate synthase